MAAASEWPDLGVPAQPDDKFEDLRTAYHQRLMADRMELVALRAALKRAEREECCDYDAIGSVAHKMAGAAAIFKATPILTATVHLGKMAKGRGSTSRIDNKLVLEALDVLIASIEDFYAGYAPRAVE